jgi:hypothetical protein
MNRRMPSRLDYIVPDSPAVFGQIYVGDDSISPYFQQYAALRLCKDFLQADLSATTSSSSAIPAGG